MSVLCIKLAPHNYGIIMLKVCSHKEPSAACMCAAYCLKLDFTFRGKRYTIAHSYSYSPRNFYSYSLEGGDEHHSNLKDSHRDKMLLQELHHPLA